MYWFNTVLISFVSYKMVSGPVYSFISQGNVVFQMMPASWPTFVLSLHSDALHQTQKTVLLIQCWILVKIINRLLIVCEVHARSDDPQAAKQWFQIKPEGS